MWCKNTVQTTCDSLEDEGGEMESNTHPPTPSLHSPSLHVRTHQPHHTPFTRASLSMCSDSEECLFFLPFLAQSPALLCWACNWLVTGSGSTMLHQADFTQPH